MSPVSKGTTGARDAETSASSGDAEASASSGSSEAPAVSGSSETPAVLGSSEVSARSFYFRRSLGPADVGLHVRH